MKKLLGYLLVTLVVIALNLGYILNIVWLTRCNFKEPYKAEAIRIIGFIVPPVGIIAGYIHIKDK
jgi:hypothetical protein